MTGYTRGMSKNLLVRIFLYASFAAFFFQFVSCASTPPEKKQTIQKASAPDVKAPAAEKKTQEKPLPVKTENSSFTLDKETYTKTKQDIARLIKKLNTLIEDRDYNAWLTYLSKGYYDYYSNPEVLKEQSESPLLKKYNITLRSLKDYFNYVVVGSRKNVRLDEIKAIDANHIKAYMYINNTPVIIYELVRINNQWKIAHF